MDKSVATYSTLGQNGRMGNQIFQIAGTIAYALDNNMDFCFPEWEYSKYMFTSLPVGRPRVDVRQPVEFHYAPIPRFPNKNVDLFNGHMQSAKYFQHRWAQISPFLTLSDEWHYYIWNKYGKTLCSPTCSVHVRRTDYDTPVNRDYHGLMPMEYYEEAVRILYGASRPDDVTFIICSDDPQWCEENFKWPKKIISREEPGIIDMFLMSYCGDHIIANSSFSWWSAFLGKSHSKRVVCPKKWFNNAPVNSRDVACEGWIVL